MNLSPGSKRNLVEHPFYFGVFANMARHNVFKILNEIAERTGTGKPANNEDKMWEADVIACLNETESKKKRNLPEDQRKVILKLHEHFRFLKALNITLDAANPDYKKYYEVMRNFLEQLDNTRNQFSHAIHTQTPFNADLIKWMEYIFDDGLKELRTRVTLDEKKLLHIKRYEGLETIKDEHGRRIKRPKLNQIFQYNFYGKDTVTEKGLAFFICLFLEQDYSNLFLKKLIGFKKGGTPEEKATLSVYSIYSVYLPQSKLQSDGHSPEALLLDMLNELERCPNELYETLSEADKEKFVTKMISSIDDEELLGEESNSILRRKQNRFPYFALRYIDTMEIFNRLRFHVDLGNYHFKSYSKQMDNMNITRRWEKKLLTFGRLDDFETEKMPKNYSDLLKDPATIDDNTPAPFIMTTTPHYHFMGTDENSIGIKNILIEKDGIKFKPIPFLEFEKKPATQEPDYFLANDELTGLLLYEHFAKEYNYTNAEKVIIDFGNNVKKFLKAFIEKNVLPIGNEKITNQNSSAVIARLMKENDFKREYKERKNWLAEQLKKYSLEPHQVPETICKYLMRIEPVATEERAASIAEFLLDETRMLLNRTKVIERGTRDYNKKKEQKKQRNMHLRAGDSALFLAKDILFMQPPLKNDKGESIPEGKANPDEFQLLQSRIAFFGREKNNLQNTFRICKLIESENPHPFLNKIDLNKCHDNLAFYKAYLIERENFLNYIIERNELSKYHFLLTIQATKDDEYFIDHAKRIANKPVNLPRGLFKDALVELLQNKGNEEMKKLVQGENVKHNVVFLINEFYKQSGDGYQPFYDFKRNYRTVDEWINDRPGDRKPLNKKYKTVSELTTLAEEIKKSKQKRENSDVLFYTVYCNKVVENEKLIRHYRAADQMLFLMTKGLLIKVDETVKHSLSKGFYLKDISPDNKKSILETRIKFSIPFKVGSEEKKVSDEFKIKDYGKFRKYLKDKRIVSLLSYFKESEIPKPDIDKQLKAYERSRQTLFEAIYYFEEAMSKNKMFAEKRNQEKENNKTYIEHWKLLDWYLPASEENDILKKQVNNIRNKFSHNEYPDYNLIIPILKGERPFIDEITDFATLLYQSFTENLNKD